MSRLREHLDTFARDFALAVQRVTRLRASALVPAAEAAETAPDALSASDAHLPGAGWIVGIAGCLAFALMALALRGSSWSGFVAAVAATAVTATLTAARGETALYRTAERLQVQGPPGKSGAGTLVLVLVLAGKFGLLAAVASLSAPAVIATLFAGQVVSRLGPLLLARSLGAEVLPRTVQFAALWCAVPLLLLWPAAGLASLLLAVIATTLACYGLWRLARQQAEPADRDLLACAQPVCELAFYLGAVIGL